MGLKTTCKTCGDSGKTVRHHPLVCPETLSKNSTTTNEKEDEIKTVAEIHEVHYKETLSDDDSWGLLELLEGTIISHRLASIESLVTIFVDPGSTCNLVTLETVRKHGYKPIRKEETEIRTVQDQIISKTFDVYNITIVDRQGERHTIECLGIDTIKCDHEEMPTYITKYYAKKFNVNHTSINNPDGHVGILLGLRSNSLHPRPFKHYKEMSLSKTKI